MTAQQGIGADQLRRRAAQRLAAAGIESAGADAAELVAQLLGVEPGRLLLIDDVSADDQARIDAAIALREQRIPLQHITSRAYFAGLELQVGPGVFIPRPETELLVEWAVARIAQIRATGVSTIEVVDLCSGSGALALAIASMVPSVRVTAVELSETAGEYLRRNIDALGLHERVRLIRADVTDAGAIGSIVGNAHLVVSNPPYVPADSPVSPEVAHDPPEAVFSGASGMDLIDLLVPILGDALTPGAPVAIEHDDTTAPQVCEALARAGGFEQISSHRDLAGRPRFVSAVRRDASGSTERGEDCVEGWKA